MTTTKDRALMDVFTTACEGGINHWFRFDKYRWCKDRINFEPDFEGFEAIGYDFIDGGDIAYIINRQVIEEGIDSLAKRLVGDDLTLSLYHTVAILELWKIVNAGGNELNLDYDANTADLIVQQGLFGEIIYG